MTKIRCGKDLGIDINHVIGWKLFVPDKKRGETLVLFLLAAGDTFHVSKNLVGCQAFTHLHKLLLEQFPIDLAAGTDCLQPVDFVLDEPLELSFETSRDERLGGSS